MTWQANLNADDQKWLLWVAKTVKELSYNRLMAGGEKGMCYCVDADQQQQHIQANEWRESRLKAGWFKQPFIYEAERALLFLFCNESTSLSGNTGDVMEMKRLYNLSLKPIRLMYSSRISTLMSVYVLSINFLSFLLCWTHSVHVM